MCRINESLSIGQLRQKHSPSQARKVISYKCSNFFVIGIQELRDADYDSESESQSESDMELEPDCQGTVNYTSNYSPSIQ